MRFTARRQSAQFSLICAFAVKRLLHIYTMQYTQYSQVDEFLNRMVPFFEQTEVLNGLMFGICLQLKQNLFTYGGQPFLAIIEDQAGIQLAALMTPPYKLQICTPTSVSASSIEALTQGLLANAWSVPGVGGEKCLAKAFAQAWATVRGCGYHIVMQQCLYELRQVQAIASAPGTFRQATPQDMELAIAWDQAFHADCFGNAEPNRAAHLLEQRVVHGNLFFWEDPMPVSMAARTRPTRHGESISYVYTPPEHRRRGYATSVVAALSQRILDEGKQFCCLYTDLANPTSNSIYQKIGYAPVADAIEMLFDESRL